MKWAGGRREGWEEVMARRRRGARRVLPAPVWPTIRMARGRRGAGDVVSFVDVEGGDEGEAGGR